MEDRERPSVRTRASPAGTARRSCKIVSWRLQNIVNRISSLKPAGPVASNWKFLILNRRMPGSNLFPQESKHAETDLDFLSLKDSRIFLQGVITRYRPKEALAERVWAAEDLVGRARFFYQHQRKQNQKAREES